MRRRLTNYSYLVRKYCLAKDISGGGEAITDESALGTTPPALRALNERATLDQLAHMHPLSVR